MTTDLISRAQAGDENAFRALTEPHRRELHVHCYRMLGSYQDAEDALQDTLLSAWQGLGAFARRASIRTWLYRIATNRCLNARRRPAPQAWDVPGVEMPEPTRLGEIVWLEPYPDDPEARYQQTESISLAFITALQALPPRQVAVLILRDVLEFRASEVAEMLDTTVESVNSALKRARAGLEHTSNRPSPNEDALVAKFVAAYEAADLDTIVAMLTDDVFVSMPPMPFEYVGRDAAAEFCARILAPGRRFTLMPARANGQPAFGTYLHGRATGLIVLTLSGERISAMTRFERGVLPWFGLPRSLP